MGKLARTLVAGVLSFSMLGGVAAAEHECTITGTGPGSVNECTFNSDESLTVNCTNGATLNFTNDQLAQSGTAIVDGNTEGGDAVTGDASNDNQLAVDFLVEGCAAGAEEATPGQPGNGGAPTAPPAGGQGGGEQSAAPAAPAPARGQAAPAAENQAAPAPVEVKALPETGASDIAAQAGIGALALGTVAGLAQLAFAGYRRFSLGL